MSNAHSTPAAGAGTLRRELGVFGATMMGLGAIVGTGVFVSIGVAAGVTGSSVVLAIAIAGLVAACNALSSAQLAASHPTSGGTYEYGYVYLTPSLGFSAGWMFLCAKSASAATAALGFAGYALLVARVDNDPLRIILAEVAIVALVLIVIAGLRRSNIVNIAIVSITFLTLGFFVFAGLPRAIESAEQHLLPIFPTGDDGRRAVPAFLEATALMFVAYTGYGRIATMGEEVKSPARTIPRAIITTLIVSMALYIAVGVVGIGAVGADNFGDFSSELVAPLAIVAESFEAHGGMWILSIGAITAMLGVLLNLVLGLSRVALAMGRRGDLPHAFGKLNKSQTTPTAAVLLVGVIIAALAAFGSVKLAWSFSAFTVLVYYAITNLAAIRLPREKRLYHPAISWAGLIGCLSLAFWVETRIWIAGLLVLGAGFLLRLAIQRSRRNPNQA